MERRGPASFVPASLFLDRAPPFYRPSTPYFPSIRVVLALDFLCCFFPLTSRFAALSDLHVAQRARVFLFSC